MPTTLPVRSPESTYGRKRGLTRFTAAVMLWALAMLALTLPTHPAHTADTDELDIAAMPMVMP